jgi:DNA-binding IclR family transcriptional regulator
MLDAEMPPSILSKAFALLRAFSGRDRVMTLSELARASGLPKSTVHRLLARLTELGAIEPHGAGYKIGLEVFQFGSVTPAYALRDRAMPYLAALHQWAGHIVCLAVLRQHAVVLLERLAVPKDASKPGGVGVGTRLPAHCTAIGKALLAYEPPDTLTSLLLAPLPALRPRSVTDVDELTSQLHAIRRSGLARSADESVEGIASIAAPIVVKGCAVGAICVAYPLSAKLAPRIDNVLRETAARLARDVREGIPDRRVPWLPPRVTDPEMNLLRNAG